MQWEVDWGDSLEFLEEVANAGGDPPALRNRPDKDPWMQEYLTAFSILNQTRSYGMGPNPITLTELLAYIKVYEPLDQVQFIGYILLMDATYLGAKSKRAEREKKK